MDSLYTNEVRQTLNTRNWPLRLWWEVTEMNGYLRMWLLRDNLNSLSGEDKLLAANTMNETLGKISKSGIPIQVKVVKDYEELLKFKSGLAD